MEHHIDMSGAKPDLHAIENVVSDLDPGAVLAMARDGRTLRIATYLPVADLPGLMQHGGSRVVELPFICCGGCRGRSAWSSPTARRPAFTSIKRAPSAPVEYGGFAQAGYG
jgi:hypothetical protein